MRRARLRGFTLIETLAALAILGAVTAVSTLALRTPPRLALDATARGVVADLRRARGAALDLGQVVPVYVDAQEKRVEVPRLELSRALPRRVEIDATGAALADDGGGDQRLRILFFADGTSSGAQINLRQATRVAGIRVHWLSGAVRYDIQ